MKGIEFIGIELQFEESITDDMRLSLDLGAVTLKKGGRSYLLDVTESHLTTDPYTLQCSVEEDREVLTESNYDLTQTDLVVGELDEATLYIGEEYIEEPQTMTLYIKSDDSLTKAINLKID